MLLKAAVIGLVIAGVETLHGVARIRLLNPRLGDRRARRVAVLTGSLLILLIAWLAVPWLGPATPGQCLAIGAVWLGLMLAYDLALGRLVFRLSWTRIAADFDPGRGGLLGLGMLFLFCAPLLAAVLRGLL